MIAPFSAPCYPHMSLTVLSQLLTPLPERVRVEKKKKKKTHYYFNPKKAKALMSFCFDNHRLHQRIAEFTHSCLTFISRRHLFQFTWGGDKFSSMFSASLPSFPDKRGNMISLVKKFANEPWRGLCRETGEEKKG